MIGERNLGVPCRVYAPVGSHEDLLPYLSPACSKRRQHQFRQSGVDEDVSIRDLVADPCELVRHLDFKSHHASPADRTVRRTTEVNSMCVNLSNDNELSALAASVNAARKPWLAEPRFRAPA